MFWIITRSLEIKSLQKRQKELDKTMTALGQESTVPPAFEDALAEWNTNETLLKIIAGQNNYFVSRAYLKKLLKTLKSTRAEMLSALGSMALPEEMALKVLEDEKIIALKIRVIEDRLRGITVFKKIWKVIVRIYEIGGTLQEMFDVCMSITYAYDDKVKAKKIRELSDAENKLLCFWEVTRRTNYRR